jgi:vancomycin resistance protein YoaR
VYVWAQRYDGRIPPGVSLAGIDVGGQDPEHVRTLLQSRIDTLLTDGVSLTVEGETQTLAFTSQNADDLVEDVTYDLDALETAMLASHSTHRVIDTWEMLLSALTAPEVDLNYTIVTDRIQARVRALFPEKETRATEASFAIAATGETWQVDVVEGHPGREFVWRPFFQLLEERIQSLKETPLTLSLVDTQPRILAQQANQLIDPALAALAQAPYVLTLQDLSWELTGETLATLLTPGEDGNLTLNETTFASWVSTITQEVNQHTQDARLVIENGRVTEFVESREGKTVDEAALKEALTSRVQAASGEPVEIVVRIEEPSVKTEDVNDLGITEVLGVGTSSYRGSPTNRRGNIQNGVDLLNGILIAPGETFSLLSALSPFTTDNGYLPELVIKGDKITPEIGGGLCQIGTTTFRATMNSGLPVVERQNHSLVVSYYNDPSNGNPGTDATIYEPAPDFKFTNDTGTYMLFQAENLVDLQQLQFTFWGTSDGRVGSYSPPVVERWIPVGETVRTETTDLEPGKEQCQSSHIGADASFTYTIARPDGMSEEIVFTSHYRPLPEICLVGVEASEEINESVDTNESSAANTSDETNSFSNSNVSQVLSTE